MDGPEAISSRIASAYFPPVFVERCFGSDFVRPMPRLGGSHHIESVSQSSHSSLIRMAPNATQGPVRPKFLPRYPALKSDLADTDEPGWISVVENDAYFSLDFVRFGFDTSLT
jgi:hypothetical protein